MCDTTCVLCGNGLEDRDHLFKICSFTPALQYELISFLDMLSGLALLMMKFLVCVRWGGQEENN